MHELPLIWTYKSEEFGLNVDSESGELTWFVRSNRHSEGDKAFATQTPALFAQDGPPLPVGPLPEGAIIGLRDALDKMYMRHCLKLACQSAADGEAAVGSVLVRQGRIVGTGTEKTKQNLDPAGHAEIIAIRETIHALATENRNPLLLSECTLYTSVEPCFMCAYAIREAHIHRVIIGTTAGEIGAVYSNYPILNEDTIERWGTPPEVKFGVLGEESKQILQRKSAHPFCQ